MDTHIRTPMTHSTRPVCSSPVENRCRFKEGMCECEGACDWMEQIEEANWGLTGRQAGGEVRQTSRQTESKGQ